MKIDGMKEKLLGIGGNVRAKGNAIVNGICINYGLDKQAVVKLLSEMEDALKKEIEKSGQTVTGAVAKQITELVENRVVSELLKIEGQISKTEEEIKSAVQANFARLQGNIGALVSDIRTDIANLAANQQQTFEAVQLLAQQSKEILSKLNILISQDKSDNKVDEESCEKQYVRTLKEVRRKPNKIIVASVFALGILLFFAFSIPLLVAYKNPIHYEVNEDGVCVVGTGIFFDNSKSELVLDTYNGKPITEIKEGAFKNKNLTKLTLGSSVKKIGNSAFQDCKSLSLITVKNDYLEIGAYAFSGCNSLSVLLIENGNNAEGVSIGEYAFANCALTSLQLNNVKYVGIGAFSGCNNLTDIFMECDDSSKVERGIFSGVSNVNIHCSVVTEVVLRENGTDLSAVNLVTYSPEIIKKCIEAIDLIGTITLEKEGLIVLAESAYIQLTDREKMFIHNYPTLVNARSAFNVMRVEKLIQDIGEVTLESEETVAKAEQAYASISKAEKAKVSNYQDLVDSRKFLNLLSKFNFTLLDDGTYSISAKTFTALSGEVILPEKVGKIIVSSIEDYAFCGCVGLTSIEVPNSVTSIGTYAFKGCSGLINIEIPNSVTSIGNTAFYNCSALTDINYNGSKTTWNEFNIVEKLPSNCTVHCTDGDIKSPLDELKVYDSIIRSGECKVAGSGKTCSASFVLDQSLSNLKKMGYTHININIDYELREQDDCYIYVNLYDEYNNTIYYRLVEHGGTSVNYSYSTYTIELELDMNGLPSNKFRIEFKAENKIFKDFYVGTVSGNVYAVQKETA